MLGGEAVGSEVRDWTRRSAFSARFLAMSERRAASCVLDVGGDEGRGCGESRASGVSMWGGVPGGRNLSAFRIQDRGAS